MASLTFAADDQLPPPEAATAAVVAGPPTANSGGGVSGGGVAGEASADPVPGGEPTTTSVGPAAGAPAAPSTTTTPGPGGRTERAAPAATPSDPGHADPTSSPPPSAAATPTSSSPAPAVSSTAAPRSGLTRRSSVEGEVLSLTNRDRAADGQGPVSRDGCMDDRASGWARHMAETRAMSHSADAGPSVTGCRGANAAWADNVGNGLPCSAADMQRWWMGSSGHRANLLGARYTAVGIGVWADASGRCWFQVYFGS